MANVTIVQNGDVLSLSQTGANASLGANLDIVFSSNFVRVTGLNGTQINGASVLTFTGATSIAGSLGNANDVVNVTGTAKQFSLNLGAGANAVKFDKFTASAATAINSENGALTFSATTSAFSALTVTGGKNLNDAVDVSQSTVRGKLTVQLYAGLNSMRIVDSNFNQAVQFDSTGDNTRVEIEAGIPNGIGSNFQGTVTMNVGNAGQFLFSPLVQSDLTSFANTVTLKGGNGSTLDSDHATYSKSLKLTKVTRI